MKKISVIIIAYNEEKNIAKCIDSILSQTRKAAEIIVVNDGSTDKTKEILDRYKNKIKAINKEENEGRSKAYASGFNHATGNIVAFIDGDSYAPTNWLKKIADGFQHAKADVACIGGYYISSNNKKTLARLEGIYNQMGAQLGLFNMPSGTNVAYLRKILKDLGTFKKLPKWRPDKHPMDVLAKNKYKIIFKPFYVFSVAPETIKIYIKQKFRWGRDGIPLNKKIKLSHVIKKAFIFILPILILILAIKSYLFLKICLITVIALMLALNLGLYFKFRRKYRFLDIFLIIILKSIAVYTQAAGFIYEYFKQKIIK